MSIKDKYNKIQRIGLFDSGLGGLSVLKQLLMLPGQDEFPPKEYIYFADTARCPYGGRSQTEIQQFVKQIVSWLSANKADQVVMACNTSAALIEPSLRTEYALPMIDLLSSTAQDIPKKGIKRVGVMSTKATAASLAFTKAIKERDGSVEVFELACPDLVPLVEGNKTRSKEAVDTLTPYISELIANNVEAIIYGCTHFPFLEESMRRVLLENNAMQVELIDPAVSLRADLSGTLIEADNSAINTKFEQLNKRCRFITTGNIDSLAQGVSTHLGLPFNQIEFLSIDKLSLGTSTNACLKSASHR